MRLALKSAEDTLLLGRELGSLLAEGDLITLEGDLGAGKTTLVQGIGAGMQVIDPVTSPTFTLVQEYRGRVPLFHIDPYRLKRPEEAESFGFYDYLNRDGVTVIEWASRIEPLLPLERLAITLDHISEIRIASIIATGKRAERVVAKLNACHALLPLVLNREGEEV
jgi:tRNA threonylcarbamoyladenosine biosynthesis protein TsaE